MIMNKRIILWAVAIFAAVSVNAVEQALVDYVNPFVGTDGYGNVYPLSLIHI